jgi:hypothetical protein
MNIRHILFCVTKKISNYKINLYLRKCLLFSQNNFIRFTRTKIYKLK